MVCLGLLTKLTGLLGIEIDLEELGKTGEYLQQMLNRLLAGNDELRLCIQKLEEQYDLEGTAPGELFEDADKIVKEVENFLRNECHKGETS